MKRSGSVELFSIRGVALRLHFSLIFLMVYIVFIAAIQFPIIAAQTHIPLTSLRGGELFWGILFAIGIFVSVVLHEFGHVFVAQSYGVKVRSITLMMLGGVSEMEQMPERPYAEFKLAIVGPLVSLGLFGILEIIRGNTSSPNLYFFSYWLGSANLILGIFNLLPAFPLDGGRALRSFLAARYGQVKGTKTAIKVSKVLAWILGIIGFLQFNLLLMLIAFFIHFSAQSELFFLHSKGLLRGLYVRDVAYHCKPIDPKNSLNEVAAQMMENRQTVLPGLSKDHFPTIISHENMKRIDRSKWQATKAFEVMEPALKAVAPTDLITSILPDILQTPSNALPVMENKEVVGIITYIEINALLHLKSLEKPSTSDDTQKAA